MTPSVGETARRTRTVRAEDIELFTEVTGDRNPLHYDEEAARRSWSAREVARGPKCEPSMSYSLGRVAWSRRPRNQAVGSGTS